MAINVLTHLYKFCTELLTVKFVKHFYENAKIANSTATGSK